MTSFRNTARGQGQAQGRVCHRIVLPELSGRRRAARGKSLSRTPPLEFGPEPAPAALPLPLPELPQIDSALRLEEVDLARLEEDLVARTLARLRSRLAEDGGADPKRIEMLERRLSKISGMLDERDRLIKTLMRRKAVEDEPGISSIYRGVQGVDDEDGHAEAKKAMMSSIFQANLALRGKTPSK